MQPQPHHHHTHAQAYTINKFTVYPQEAPFIKERQLLDEILIANKNLDYLQSKERSVSHQLDARLTSKTLVSMRISLFLSE